MYMCIRVEITYIHKGNVSFVIRTCIRTQIQVSSILASIRIYIRYVYMTLCNIRSSAYGDVYINYARVNFKIITCLLSSLYAFSY